MKRYLFIYMDSCDYFCWPSKSYEGVAHNEDAEFSKGTSDWQILEAARSMEIDNEPRDQNYTSENVFTRKLLRVVEIARELEVNCSGGL